jgi:hypothetical protein
LCECVGQVSADIRSIRVRIAAQSLGNESVICPFPPPNQSLLNDEEERHMFGTKKESSTHARTPPTPSQIHTHTHTHKADRPQAEGGGGGGGHHTRGERVTADAIERLECVGGCFVCACVPLRWIGNCSKTPRGRKFGANSCVVASFKQQPRPPGRKNFSDCFYERRRVMVLVCFFLWLGLVGWLVGLNWSDGLG